MTKEPTVMGGVVEVVERREGAVVAGNLVSQSLRIPSSETTLAICGNTRAEMGTVWSYVVRRPVRLRGFAAI